jgi:nucleotide-binding universal stress UspA family protein
MAYPFRRILIPTDFSTASEWVFDDAVRIAGATGAEIIILHVRMTRASNPTELRFPADAALYDYAEQQELETLRTRVRQANRNVPTRLVVREAPDVGAEIARVAAEEQADLVVIATHARHHVAHLLIGSTTLSVIVNPPAPLLAIRYGVQKRPSLKRIVLPVHPQQATRCAHELAVAIAKHAGAELHYVTVCADGDRSRAEEHLKELEAATPWIQVRTGTIRGDDVEKEICRYVERVDADILVLNANGEPGPVKRDLIRNVGVPVMIVPAEGSTC